MVEQIVTAGSSDHFRAFITRNAFRTLVPVGDDALTIHEINPIVQVIDQVFVKFQIFGHTASMMIGDTCNNSGRLPECLNRMNYIQKSSDGNYTGNTGKSAFSFDYNLWI